MHFVEPLAFAFAAAIPVVVLFYLLKRKRVVRLVASTLLWKRFLAESQASSPFQKLRHNWLLLLQILILILVVLALARPFFSSPTPVGRLLVFILDTSASMQATDESPTRFKAAQQEALKWVDSLADSDQAVVLTASAGVDVRQSPTTAKQALRKAITGAVVTDGPTRLQEALKLGETLVRDRALAEIHLFSDGVAAHLGDFQNKNLPLIFHAVGKRNENAAIVSFDVRTHPEDPQRRVVYCGVANYSSNVFQTELELRFDGDLLETRPLRLPGKSTVSEVFFASQKTDGILSARLTLADDLPADNQASAMSLLPRPIHVLLLTKGNRFLEKALSAASRVELETSPTASPRGQRPDIVVLDDVPMAEVPAQNLLLFHVAPPIWFPAVEEAQSPVVVDWKTTHPLMRFTSFENVQITSTLAVKPPPWAIPLVEATQTPLILAGENKRQRVIWVGFDLLQSTWPLRVSFPIFIANAMEWLDSANVAQRDFMLRAGDPLRVPLTGVTTNSLVTITPPQGSPTEFRLDGQSTDLVYGNTTRQGIYTVRQGTNDLFYCANVLDPQESDLQPRSEIMVGKHGRVASTTLRRANLEIWRPLAALGLLVLMWEWWYFHRRTA